jgi:lysophospholipase L1-like esterase
MPSLFYAGQPDYIEKLNTLATALTADKFVEAAGASVSPSVYRYYAFNSGTSYTFGGDFKAGKRNRVNLFCNNGALFNATFNLKDGVVESGSGATITALGDGWYRCQQTITASTSAGANLQIRVYPTSGGHPYTGDGASGIFANDAYLTAGGSNLLTNSSAFFGGEWNLQNVSVVPDVAFFGGAGYVSGDVPAPYVDPGVTALLGKKISVIGTSITEQAQYTVPLATLLGVTLVNLGTSGGSLASGSHYGSLYIYNAITSIPSDSNVVIVEAGTNDFGTDNSTLGALGDTTTSTFYGAIFAACVAIRSRAPNAKIIFLTPYSGDSRTSTYRILRTNTKGHTLDQFQKAVEEGAGYCGYAVVDVGRQSGIGYHTGTIYLGDGLHLNATGGLRFSNFVAEGLRSLARGGYLD